MGATKRDAVVRKILEVWGGHGLEPGDKVFEDRVNDVHETWPELAEALNDLIDEEGTATTTVGPFQIFYAGRDKLFMFNTRRTHTRASTVNILINLKPDTLAILEVQDRFGHRVGADTFLADYSIRTAKKEAKNAEA